MAKIGFVGLGHMGQPMCINLLKNKHQIKVYDLVTEAVDHLVHHGAQKANDLADIVNDVEIVISMLPEGKHVSQVYLGEKGLLSIASNPLFFVDCSTIDVQTAQNVAQKAISLGHQMVDAPVSGGVKGAENALLTFMVGGTLSNFECIRPILTQMGKNIFHCGDNGTGQAAKICNNLMLAISMIGTSEAFALASTFGLSKEKLFEVASTSSGQSWSLTSYCPVSGPLPTSPANFDYKAGFTAQMMLKDLKLANALNSDIQLPLGQKAMDLYDSFCTEGNANLDFSGIYLKIAEQKK
jgi:3-hydroxyisobutyrate dehydrogenase